MLAKIQDMMQFKVMKCTLAQEERNYMKYEGSKNNIVITKDMSFQGK